MNIYLMNSFFFFRNLDEEFYPKSKVTVIGLFGKEKCHDSNKAIEIFDHLAQRDIFSLLDREDEEVSSIQYILQIL